MQVPEQIGIAVEIAPHQRLACIIFAEKLIEESSHLTRIHGIKVGRDRGNIDALAAVVGSALVEPLNEDRKPVLLEAWRPVVVKEPPQIVRKRKLLAECPADKGKVGRLRLKEAFTQERLEDVLDVGGVVVFKRRVRRCGVSWHRLARGGFRLRADAMGAGAEQSGDTGSDQELTPWQFGGEICGAALLLVQTLHPSSLE